MSRRATKDARSRPCDATDARKRLGDAEKYLEVAQLVATEDSLEAHNVAAGLAVLAGIVAADAACCWNSPSFAAAETRRTHDGTSTRCTERESSLAS